jgi:predicted CopG family antitoxin
MRLKTIKIREETHRRLLECGRKGETFDELINRLIDELGRAHERGKVEADSKEGENR